MVSLQFVDFAKVFLFLFCVIDVSCQRVRFEQTSPRNTCPADSPCRRFRRCRAYNGAPNWQGVSCGPGWGDSRRVCCPRRLTITTTRRPPYRTTTARPSTSTRRPVISIAQITRRPNSMPNFNDAYRCGESRIDTDNIIQGYVMGGKKSVSGEWPWMVAIQRRTSSGEFRPHCTGFLIDPRHVMSAAHCYHNKSVTLYQARIGHIDQTMGDIFSITRIAVSDRYIAGQYYGDIAILTLNREVSPDLATPICLPDPTIMSMNLVDTGTSVAGWGTIRHRGPLSLVLRHLQFIPVWSNEDCNRTFRERLGRRNFRRQFPQGIDSSFMCAGYREGGRDACGGDSGGPLMKQDRNRWFAIGIVSFGIECGLRNVPGVYTKISEYMNWIRDNTRN